MATNTEFTTWPRYDEAVASANGTRYADTTFKLDIADAHAGQPWMTKQSHFKLQHVPTSVHMWTHSDVHLPDWGFKQQEVNGNKNALDKTNFWFVDEIIVDPSASRALSALTLQTRPCRCDRRRLRRRRSSSTSSANSSSFKSSCFSTMRVSLTRIRMRQGHLIGPFSYRASHSGQARARAGSKST